MRRRRPIAALLALALLSGAAGRGWAAAGPSAPDSYSRALRLRAQLDSTPRSNRTERQYGQVLDAFRAVYHADRADPNAAGSVEAVAELLAEEGRLFTSPGLLRSAVDQLEFLRRDFAASRYSVPALLTEGEIESRDLHDPAAAGKLFTQFLAQYPHNPLAPQARAELRRIAPGATAPAVAETRPRAQPLPEADFNAIGEGAQATAPVTGTPRTNVFPPPDEDSPDIVSNHPRPAQVAAAPQTGQLQERDITPSAAPAVKQQPTSGAAAASAVAPTRMVSGVPVYRAASGKLTQVTGIRQWSTANYTRIAIDVAEEVPFEASRVSSPDRIFFDLYGAKLAPELAGRAISVTDGGFLERIRAAQFSGDIVRVVLDVTDVSDYSAFWLPNPSRLIIDIHGRAKGAPPPLYANARPATPASGTTPSATPQAAQAALVPAPHTPASRASAAGTPTPQSAHAAAPGTFVAETTAPGASAAPVAQRPGDSVAAIAALSQQPSRVRATRAPTTAPVASVTAPAATQGPRSPTIVADSDTPDRDTSASPTMTTSPAATVATKRKRRSADGALPTATPESTALAAQAAAPDSTGGRSMVRALGLKINRIVVDAGHGGHDSGTLGPGGIEEKDVVLDVALRLGKLLKQRLGADVIYTRDDDTFIPLETRTAIANKAQADLFISVHANSSSDPSARGVETYYLNFTTSADALEVAARENAVSDESIHQLSDLVKKITLQDKIAESREFASDVESSLYQGLESGNSGLKERGVKKAPFVVLIGANMPSILAEISFLTNPDDASELRDPAYRERIAEALYKGVARYVRSLAGSQLQASAGSN